MDDREGIDHNLIDLIVVAARAFAADPLSLVEALRAGATSSPQLIRIGRQGGPEDAAFAELFLEAYESISDQLTAVAVSKVGANDADDLTQTTFMRVFARWPDHITTVDGLRSYLWRTHDNLIKDAWAKQAARRENTHPDGQDRIEFLVAGLGTNIDDAIAVQDLVTRLLGILPSREREALVLHAWEGRTYKDTAAVMGVAEGTVKRSIHDALGRIRSHLATGDAELVTRDADSV